MLRARFALLALGALTGAVIGCRSDFQAECPIGTEECACTENGACDPGLMCLSNTCVGAAGETGDTMASADETGSAEGTDVSSADGDATSGDGDDTTTTSGDGDTATTTTTGDGDGDGDVDAPETPELRTPIQDAYVGSAHAASSLRPRFTWTAVQMPMGASSLSYELEYATDAAFTGSDVGLSNTPEWQPVSGLAVPITQPVGARYFWRVRACADSTICSEWSEARWVNVGRPQKDVNGDGFPDVLGGAPDSTNFGAFGTVSIFRGGQGTGFEPTVDYTLTGDLEGYRYGRAVVAADVNGDGYADVIVGSNGLNDRGRVQVHLSNAGTPTSGSYVEFNDQNWSVDAHYGWSLASLGDINGDGYADFAAGDPGSNGVDGNYPGYVHVYLGSANFSPSATHLERTGIADSDRFGTSLAGGDFNGDGYSDLVVGAPNRAGGGAAYIYLGSQSGLGNVAWATLTASGSTNLGAAVASAGDVNGDGYADVIVGDEGSLAAHIYFGGADAPSGTPDHSMSGPANSLFGRAVGSGGDMDRDGYSEALVSAPGYTVYGSGAVQIWRGAPTLQAQADGQINYFHMSNGEVGNALGLSKDTNGDGFVEVPVAKGYSYTGIFVFLGAGGLVFDDDPPELPGANDFGFAVY